MSQGILGVLIPVLQKTYRKILQNHEPEALGNPLLFIDVLEEAQTMILGDKEEELMNRLQKAEASKSTNK